ncbi:MAG: sulfite exporter TauE/SafE family protein, partial [SAR202 cluster bacterium]|nr:sulfite exporter TauE/SafE family protein [SAR202 cluster bacterium]
LGIPGPFAAVFYLAYGLVGSSFIGTSSMAMGIIQIPKLIIYGNNELLTLKVVLMGIGLGAIGAVTAVIGRWILRRVPERVFPWIVTTMLLIAGIVFLIRG